MNKIFELKIDEEDEISGIQYLSIVKKPATEIGFEVFSSQENNTCHSCHVEEDFNDVVLNILDEFGVEPNPDMFLNAEIKDVKIEITPEAFGAFTPDANARAKSRFDDDSDGATRISRYIYVIDTGVGAPLIKTSRQMCRKLIGAAKVYTREDIEAMSVRLSAQPDTFKLAPRAQIHAQADSFEYKMGNRCRHKWAEITFNIPTGSNYEETLKKIPIKAAAAVGRGTNTSGASRPFISEARYLNRMPTRMSAQDELKPIGFHMGLFVYNSRKSALFAEPTAQVISKVKLGSLEGYCPVDIDESYFEGTGKVIEKFKIRHTFAKIPDYMREAAKRAVEYADENGWGDCGTDVGKRRANDLADPNYEPSLDILTRMYSYGSRHKVDWESSKSIDEGCGYLMMLSWSFSPSNYDEAMNWLERQINNATEENMKFSSDEFKGDITAVVFEPDTYIYRFDNITQTPYYVFMSRETIRKGLMKLSRLKPKNLINLEHTDKVFSGEEVFSYENWLVADNPKEDKSYQIFGREMKPGTWITTIHFKNRKLFDDFILSQKTSGISLEGMFEEVPFNFFDIKEEGFVKPTANETKDEFISRCMGDSKMLAEFPNERQRAAVCYSYYENKFIYDNPCQDGYVAYGTKIKDGREVPNCVPVRASQEFKNELEIYGYTTRYFYICPGAVSTFNNLVEMNLDEETQGMVRSAALQADRVFQLEAEVIERGYATEDEYKEAVVFVDDFKDLIGEIDRIIGITNNVDYMDGHIEVIKNYLIPENENMEDITDDETIKQIKDMLKYYIENKQF